MCSWFGRTVSNWHGHNFVFFHCGVVCHHFLPDSRRDSFNWWRLLQASFFAITCYMDVNVCYCVVSYWQEFFHMTPSLYSVTNTWAESWTGGHTFERNLNTARSSHHTSNHPSSDHHLVQLEWVLDELLNWWVDSPCLQILWYVFTFQYIFWFGAIPQRLREPSGSICVISMLIIVISICLVVIHCEWSFFVVFHGGLF